jgi:hypothetical protein
LSFHGAGECQWRFFAVFYRGVFGMQKGFSHYISSGENAESGLKFYLRRALFQGME